MKGSWARRIMCGCILVMVGAMQVAAMEAEDAPESVTLDVLAGLYEPVEFDHRMHADGFDCAACHHHTTGGGTQQPVCMKCHAESGEAAEVACSGCHQAKGPEVGNPAGRQGDGRYHIDRPGLLGALHLQCLGCHRSQGGLLGCLDCHALSPAGKKRFAVDR